jgi:D-aminopeptidase
LPLFSKAGKILKNTRDVKGVLVGQKTLIVGDSIRTDVTVIMPYPGNVFQEKVPAAVFVGD